MTRSTEWQGTWFIEMPDGSEITFRGILTYDQSNGCTLKASTDEHSDQFLYFISKSNKIEIIRGYENIHHKGVLLRKCIVTNALQGIGVSITVVVSEVIENLYYEKEVPLQFDKTRIEFTALESWLDTNNSEVRLIHENDPTITYSYIYRQPDTLIFNISNEIDIKFIHSYSMAKSHEKRPGNFFTERCNCFVISKNGKIEINELDKYSEHLRRLLSMLYHQKCFAVSYSYLINREYISFDKYYKQTGFDILSNYPSYGHILVKYKEIQFIAESVFQKWFRYRESNDLTYVTYIAAKSISSFSEEIFLENVRALEVYHRVKNKKKIYFRERIISLVNSVKEISDNADFEQFIPDINRFIHLIVENRNYLTHYGDGSISKEDELEIVELYSLTIKCKIILIISLLEDLGIKANKYFSQLVNRYGNKFSKKE